MSSGRKINEHQSRMAVNRIKTMTSGEISRVIEENHTKDVVVTECKDGPSWAGRFSRMDVWVMRRSWSHPLIQGFEIKVSKSDFKNDQKWVNYLPMCNQLYFVCPKNLIEAHEVPGDVGLFYCVGKRLREVKKAAHREIEVPDSLYRYLLMCRTKIVSSTFYDTPTISDRLEIWRQWVSKKSEARELGYRVSRGVRDHVDRVQAENKRLKNENEKLQVVKNILETMGITLHTYDFEQAIRENLKNALGVVPREFEESLYTLKSCVERAQSDLNKIRERAEKNEHNLI